MRLCALKTDQTAEPRAAPEAVINMRVTRSKFQPPTSNCSQSGRPERRIAYLRINNVQANVASERVGRSLRSTRRERGEREREKDSKCVNSSAGDGAKKYGTHYGSDFAEDRDTNKQTHKSPNDETLGYLATCAPPETVFATLIFTSLAPPLLPFAPLNHPSSLPVSVARGEPGFALSRLALVFQPRGLRGESICPPRLSLLSGSGPELLWKV